MKYLSILLTKTDTCDIKNLYITSKTLLLNYIINVNNGIIFSK
ncbi:hypothetical protein [Halarcobacter sp.]|nr:hypothetical protein [Halarcobacter sp.]